MLLSLLIGLSDYRLEQMKTTHTFVKIKLSTGTIEVEKELHLDMNNIFKIDVSEGYRLLTLDELIITMFGILTDHGIYQNWLARAQFYILESMHEE